MASNDNIVSIVLNYVLKIERLLDYISFSTIQVNKYKVIFLQKPEWLYRWLECKNTLFSSQRRDGLHQLVRGGHQEIVKVTLHLIEPICWVQKLLTAHHIGSLTQILLLCGKSANIIFFYPNWWNNNFCSLQTHLRLSVRILDGKIQNLMHQFGITRTNISQKLTRINNQMITILH